MRRRRNIAWCLITAHATRNMQHIVSLALLVIVILVSCTQAPPPTPTAAVFVDGLLNPVGLSVYDGRLLIAEEGTGASDNSAGVTLVMPDGTAGRLISGLPSSRDSGDLSGVPFAAVSPDGQTLYTSHFNAGQLLTLPVGDGLQLPASPYTAADLGNALAPLNEVKLLNPFDITFDVDGVPVVSDASANGVATANPDNSTRFFHRFDPLTNTGAGKPTIDPVPTGIARVGDEYYVTLTGGCPYPANSGQLVAIDQERQQRTVVDGLNMPIDVATTQSGELLLLEFSTFDPQGSCFSGTGYLPNSGRLSRVLPDGTLQPLLTELNFPGSIAVGDDDTLYISETFSGRVLRVQHASHIEQALSVLDLLTDETAVVSLSTPAQHGRANAAAPATKVATAPAAELAIPTAPTFHFTNVAADLGIDFQHGAFVTDISPDPIAMMGGGVCWIDYDADGWLDLYLVNSYAVDEKPYWDANGGLPTNKLYRNDHGRFVDITKESGTDLTLRGNGCIAADLNLDGYMDLYVTAAGPNALLWNKGDGTFTEGAAAAGIAAPEWNTAASAGDLNGDGWPDLFVASYIDLTKKIPNPSGAFPQDFYGLLDHLYVNNGDGTFTEVTDQIGLQYEERSLGSIFTDLDRDGDLDLYIANDGQRNRLYVNQKADNQWGFELVDITLAADVGDSGSGMGVSSADYDSDGQLDLFVTNWEAELNALYRNELDESGNLAFRYSTFRIGISGLGNGMTGWGTAWADFDHDTDSDLLVVNGRVPVSDFTTDPELVRFYGNRLAEGMPNSFREWTDLVGLGSDGVGTLLARGSACADFDNDGDIDVAINTIGGSAALLESNGVTGHWLSIDLGGFYPGARAELTLPDGRTLIRELQVGSSYLASEDPRLHFGLGNVDKVDKLWISWGNGRGLIVENVDSNQMLSVDIADAQEVDWFTPAAVAVDEAVVDNSTEPEEAVDNKSDSGDKRADGEMPRAWFDLQLALIEETPGFTPPVVSRALGYSGLVLYESIVHGYSDYQSLAGQLNELDALPLPDETAAYHWPTVANTAMAYTTRKMYPNMSGKNVALVQALEQQYNEMWNIEPELYGRSAAYGVEVAQAIYIYSLSDGGDGGHWRNFPADYQPPTGTGSWIPTAPTHTAAMLPYWSLNRPFALPEAGTCEAGPPPTYSEEPDSEFYAQAYKVYETVRNLTPEQREIALFWSDDPGETPTPPGHSISVLTQVLRQENATLIEDAEAYARVGMAINDAFIGIWYTKYKYNLIRPITYIQRVIDPDWNTPYITDPVITPPFPEYTSGHSGQSGAAAAVLTQLFGDNYSFTDNTHAARGLPARHFTSFNEMALEAANSRLYGGIHYPMSNMRGVEEGQCIGEYVNRLQFRSR